MKKMMASLFAGASVLVLGATAHAQQPPVPPQSGSGAPAEADQADQAEAGAGAGDIVVTARRRSETLQEVPQTVGVVTDQAMRDYGVLNFEDLANLVPGIDLSGAGSQGFNQSIQVRGVPFQITDQAASPTTATYLNEAPVDSALIFQNTYDLGQVEVLKGPQGTSRGISSPSGAFTTSTRPADPAAGFEGYIQTTADDHDTLNLQGAINIPIIEDLFAIRLAGVNDSNDGGGVRSATTSEDPEIQTESWRVSATFTPSDSFRARFMFQDVFTENTNFGGTLFGAGECAAPYNANTAPPVGTLCTPSNANPLQPPITMDQRVADNNNANMYLQEQTVAILNLEYSVANNLISYIWSRSKWALDNYSDSDTNNLVNVRIPSRTTMAGDEPSMTETHELRIASEEPIFNGFLDYTGGLFWTELELESTTPQGAATRYPGSFGRADQAANPNVYFLDYTRHSNLTTNDRQDHEASIYGELNLHLTDSLELSIGARQLETFLSSTRVSQTGGLLYPGADYRVNLGPQANCTGSVSPVGLGAGVAQFPVGGLTAAQARTLFGLGAAAASVPNVMLAPSTNYPGTCDAIIPAGIATGAGAAQTFVAGGESVPVYSERTIRPEVYNVAISYDITDDIMVYANHGTAFRQGSVSVTQAPVCSDPIYCDRFNSVEPEHSSSYEVGFKAYLFDRRAYVEVSAYQQDFDGFVRRGSSSVRYLGEDINGLPEIQTGTFTFNADVVIDGVDALVRFDITDDWNVGFGGSYNHGVFNNANVVCNDGNFDGVPDGIVPVDAAAWTAAGGPGGPAVCPGQNTPATNSPLWNANMRSEYNFATPFLPGTRSFVRFNYNYYPENERADSTIPVLIVDERHMVDLFFGVRAEDRSWEVQAFVRNLLDDDTLTSYGDNATYSATDIATPTGWGLPPYFETTGNQYRSFSRVAEREVGVTLRYSF